MILAARKVIDKYGETFEILAAAEAIRLCEQMLDRDRLLSNDSADAMLQRHSLQTALYVDPGLNALRVTCRR